MPISPGLLLYLTLAAALPGAEFFVSPAGDDTTDGSQQRPWKTIKYAVGKAKPGDTVMVGPGAYDERVTIPVSGDLGQLITLRAEPRREAKVKAFIVQGDYIRISGFEITDDARKERASGIDCGRPGGKTPERKGCEILDNFIHDINGQAINTGTAALVKGNLLRNVRSGIAARSNTLVENNEIDTLILSGGEETGKPPSHNKYTFFSGDNITFRGNFLHHPRYEDVFGHGICFFGSGDFGPLGPSHNILIENNRCINATHASEPIGNMLKKSSGITYRNNFFMNTQYVGVFPQNWSNITVVHNTFINCGAYPVWFRRERECEGALVRNNLISYYKHVVTGLNLPAESGVANFANAMKTIDCDYNLFWACKNREYGTHDLTAEPQFVDPDNGDFRLKPGSPGIDAGVVIEGMTTDLLGNPRVLGKAPDVGCYESAP